MEPQIQYAKTEDGVSIAYWTLGDGEPLVLMPGIPFSHIQLDWQAYRMRGWYERLARKRMLVRYDGRGSGLSDREVPGYSLDAYVGDLEAVVDHLSLERFALYGAMHSGPIAIACAARHPDRISHLVLWCAWAQAADYFDSPQVQSLASLRDKDWEIYTETVAHAFLGWSATRQANRFAAYMRECVTQEVAQAAHEAMEEFDVTPLLQQVKSPALVLHRRQLPLLDLKVARGLASGIPDARLLLLEGTSVLPTEGDVEGVAQAINEFLGDGEVAGPEAGGFATILFTDMESSTALTQQLGDTAAQEVRRTHNEIVRAALSGNSGSEIKHTGDGIMASFTTASAALDCAIAIQQGVGAYKDEHPESPLGVYVGLNAGEPIAEDDDLFGTSVDLAARICDRAEPGQVLASNVVRELAAGKQFLFADLGETELRGFEDPVKLWEVRWRQ